MLESRKRIFYCCGNIETGWLAGVADLFRGEGLNIRRIDMSCPLREDLQSWLLVEYELQDGQEALSPEFETALRRMTEENSLNLLRS